MRSRTLFPPKLLAIIVFSLVHILVVRCKKESTPDNTPEPPSETITLSLTSATALPGDAVMVRSSKRIASAGVNITLNGATVKGYASGDTAYVFMVPVLAPGNVSVAIPSIANSNTVSLTINNYTAIANPQTIIDEYVSKRNRSIDSVTKVIDGSDFQPSPQSVVLLDQLKEEWALQIASLTVAEKELLAYVLQRNMPDPSQYSFTTLPPGYFAKPGDLKSDVGDKLVAIAKEYVTAQTVCIGSIPFLIATGVAFIAAPNPFSGLVFLGVFTTFVISREVAVRRAQEVGHLKGVAEEVTETYAQKTAEFFNNTEKSLNMTVSFRNLSAGDASIQQDINTAFTTEQTFVNKDREIETMYSEAAAKTTKLKGTYPSYQSIIGKKAKATLALDVEAGKIIVKGVSDPRISYSNSIAGSTKKVKITSTATEEIAFDLQVAYKRTLDGKEFTKNIPCLFKPEFDSTELYRLSVIGKYTVNNYKGNGPNSKLTCEFKADGQTVYTIYSDPSWPDGSTFGASWGITRQNGRYYFSENGFWHYGFSSIEVAHPLTYPVTGFNFHNDTYYSK